MNKVASRLWNDPPSLLSVAAITQGENRELAVDLATGNNFKQMLLVEGEGENLSRMEQR